MPQFLVLVPAFPYDNANLSCLLPELRRQFAVVLGEVETLRLAQQSVLVRTEDGTLCALDRFDLVWVLGFGQRDSFLDKLQLLSLAAPRTRFVNGVDAFAYLHAKYHLVDTLPPLEHPETYASNDPQWLMQRLQDDDGLWIAKPPASSFGRGVFRVHKDDPNALAILNQLTDHGRGRFCLMQRLVPEISNGEKRVLIAAGRVVGAYRRDAAQHGLHNLAQGGQPSICDLSVAESEACIATAAHYQARGINFAGLDLAYPWLIEINVANPGGLATLVTLGDTKAPARVADALRTLV